LNWVCCSLTETAATISTTSPVGRHREEKGTGKENETELKEKFLHKTFPQVQKALKQTFPRYGKLSNKHFARYRKLSNNHFLVFSAENSLANYFPKYPQQTFPQII
jgi:hypothetical protein